MLASLIEAGEGSLGGVEFDGTHEQQVAGLNELIASDDPEKTDTLLHLLNVEGLYIWSAGQQPPAILTLATVTNFKGLVRVWNKLLEIGADPNGVFEGQSVEMATVMQNSPVLYA